MPKVWEEEGFRFYIYYNDHTPAHVHVEKAEGEVLIHIGDEKTKPSLREVRGMSFPNVKKALTIAVREQQRLITHWRRIHGSRTG
jgi:hypothetical protein